MAFHDVSNPPTEFDHALENFTRNLSQKEKVDFRFTTISDVYREIDRIQKDQESKGLLRNLRRLQPFIDGLQRYSSIIEQFVNVKPNILAFIWGPIKLFLQISSTHVKCFDIVLNALRRIGENLPRFESFENIFKGDLRIKRVLLWIYSDILEFYAEVLNFLRKKEWKQLFVTLWTDFDSHFSYLIARLERHTVLVDNEAAAANFNEAHSFRIAARREFEEATRERHRRMLDDIKGWLSPLSFEDDIQRCQDITDLCPNTGNWLVNDPRFSTWLHEDQEPILWLSGIPGSGKTTLSYIAWDYVRAQSQANFSTALVAFLSYRNRESHSATSILRTIACSILEADLALLPLLREMQDGYPSQSRPRTRKLFEDIVERLISTTELKRVYVIVDGIDEIDHLEGGHLLRFLVKVANSNSEVLRLLVSSREISYIKENLPKAPRIIANDENAADIELYVREEQGRLKNTFSLDDEEAEAILKPLPPRSEGMFLFARLVIHSLNQQTCTTELIEAAREIPRGLDEAYARILARIERLGPNERRVAVDALEFLLCAGRLPRLLEIKYALTIEASSGGFEKGRLPRRKLDELCGPIVEVRRGIVSFVHFSAKEYLLLQESGPYLDRSMAHHKMAIRCLSYLRFPCFGAELDTDDITAYIKSGDYLWLEYVESYWLEHVKAASKVDQTHLPELDEALTRVLLRWRRCGEARTLNHDCDFGFTSFKDHSPSSYKMLVQAAMYKSQEKELGCGEDPLTLSDFSGQVWQLLERHLLSEPERNNQFAGDLREFYGTDVFKCANPACPLSVKGFSTASARDLHNRCHERPYKCNDASCEYSKLGFYTANALAKHANIHFDFDAAVENISNLNINMAPETLSQQSDPADLLLDALHSDDANQFQLALANDTWDINRRIDGESLLCRAVKRGSIGIVRLLLQVGADLRITDKWGTQPLLLASSSPEITRLLLEHGSDVHAEGLGARTALMNSKSIDVSQVLLEYGARIDASSSERKTALMDAISENRIDQARFLLERGANVNAKARYWTPLALAARFGRVDHFQLLFEYGADVNMKDGRGITPLGAACTDSKHCPPRDRALALKALLEAGADPTVSPKKPLKDYVFTKKLPQYIDMTWEELVEATRSKRLTSPPDSSHQNSLD